MDWRCAVHEAGHAVVASVLGLKVDTLSIMQTRRTGGYMRFERVDGGMHDRAYGESLVQLLLGGMAAEDVVLGSRSTAAGGPIESDLGRATSLLAAYRHSHGLGDRLVHLGAPDEVIDRVRYDPRLAAEIDHDLQRLYGAAKDIVTDHAAQIEAVATRLRTSRVMSGDAVRDLMREVSTEPLVGS